MDSRRSTKEKSKVEWSRACSLDPASSVTNNNVKIESSADADADADADAMYGVVQ
jgi:hypothetical protein